MNSQNVKESFAQETMEKNKRLYCAETNFIVIKMRNTKKPSRNGAPYNLAAVTATWSVACPTNREQCIHLLKP